MRYWRTKDIGYSGIAFPFNIDDRGSVVRNNVDLVEGTYDTIRQAIQQILLTRVGSRFFHRSFGASPIYILFRLNTPEELMLVRSEIDDFLRRWEPRCVLTHFEIQHQEESTAVIKIGYQIVRTQLQDFVEAKLPLQPGP
ncbi:MAG: GPW/gp25 family protein [Candidatus Thermoplasmatota archaeon]|nr:GPW/gp25 family protein [Candidatus Thermoplasmatota archaeon]